MTGPVALHGGAEFQAGDEPFLSALLAAAPKRGDGGSVRVVIVPVAAARQRPELAAELGAAAFQRVGADDGLPVAVDVALIVDAATADDRANAARLGAADLVYLPGGEPDLPPAVLGGTRAWAAITVAHERGAVIAGASAGAMGLAATTWTPGGLVAGLGLLPGVIVVPHLESFDPTDRSEDVDRVRRAGLGAIGLDERTGVIREATGRWRVAGMGRAIWLPPDGDPTVARHGHVVPIPA